MDTLCSVDDSRFVKNIKTIFHILYIQNHHVNKQMRCNISSTGLIIYFGYGVQHSVQKRRLQNSLNHVSLHSITTTLEQNPEQGLDG